MTASPSSSRVTFLQRWGRSWAVASVLVLLAAGFLVCAIRLNTIERELVGSATRLLAEALGVDATVAGAIEVHLFPRPEIVADNVTLRDRLGVSRIEISELKGSLTLASLLSERVGFSRVHLIEVTGSIDADRMGQMQAPRNLDELARILPSKIVVSSGVIAIRSSNPALGGLISDFNAVFDGLNANGTATANGRASWRGQRAEFSARLDPVLDFFAGHSTAGSLKLHAPLLSIAVSGLLKQGLQGGFEGTVAASTTSLPDVLRLGAGPAMLGSIAKTASFSGSGVETDDGIAFSDTRVMLNDTVFEGSLAWQRTLGRSAFTGTFATDVLDLTPVLGTLPDVRNPNGTWSDAVLPLDASSWSDIDLRVSANQAKLGRFEADDAAFSALCRDGRIEVSLGEARSFDGLIKGRAVASVTDKTLAVRLDLSAARISVAQVAATMWESQATGLASGHVTGEGHGTSVRSLLQTLQGHGQISVRQGELPGTSMMADLLFAETTPAGRTTPRRALPFDLATADFRIQQGVVSIDDGSFIGADAHVAFRGEASLVDRGFTLSSVPIPVEGATPPEASASTNVVGTWGQPFHIIRLDRRAADKWQALSHPPDLFP